MLQAELDQALVPGLVSLGLQRGPAVVGVGLVPADGEAEPGLDRGVLVGDVVAPVAVARLQPQRVHGVVAGHGQAVGLARPDEHVEKLHGVLVGQVELPAQLAHVAHAQRQHVDAGHLDALRGPEGEVGVVQRCVGERAEHEAGLGTHQPDHGPVRSDVGDLDVAVPACPAQPGPVPGLGRGRGHHQEAVQAQAGHGQVGLDTAPVVAPLRVHRSAHGHVDAGCAQLVEHEQRVGAVHRELGERGLVEQRNPFPHRPALLAGVGPPVLLAVAVDVFLGLAVEREPVGPLPPRGLAPTPLRPSQGGRAAAIPADPGRSRTGRRASAWRRAARGSRGCARPGRRDRPGTRMPGGCPPTTGPWADGGRRSSRPGPSRPRPRTGCPPS